MLRFLGRGSAFSDEHNSAFFISNKELVLIDCPASTFQKIKKIPFENIDKIYILVTHTHGDHSGGVGSMLQYAWFVLHNFVTIVTPSEDVKNDLIMLLMQIEGCEAEWFNIMTADELHRNWFVSGIPTTHVKSLDGKCFGYHLRVHDSDVIYTGDTATLEPYLHLIHSDDAYLYTETSFYKSDVHLYIYDILPRLTELVENGVHVYLMHLDNEAEISEIIRNTKIRLAPLWKLHKMKLNKQPFNAVNVGYKTIELRLNDEKRQKLNVGDWIEFSQMDNPGNKVTVEIVALHNFDSFKELYAALPLLQYGYTEETVDSANASDMESYYSKEEQALYGVLGVEIRLLSERL